MLNIQISAHRYTHHVHLILYCQECSLLHTPTHLWFVESTWRLFPLFLSLMQHARWNSLIKGIRGSHPSIPYDLPAPVKVTYRLWCLRFAVLLMQSWPLQSDVLFQVVNDYHLSMCFSCRTGNPPCSNGRIVLLDVSVWTLFWPHLFPQVETEWSLISSSVKCNLTSTTNLMQWYGYEA